MRIMVLDHGYIELVETWGSDERIVEAARMSTGKGFLGWGREWHRHRTQSYNEMSARYAPLPDLNYIPSVERLMFNATAGGKQSGATRTRCRGAFRRNSLASTCRSDVTLA